MLYFRITVLEVMFSFVFSNVRTFWAVLCPCAVLLRQCPGWSSGPGWLSLWFSDLDFFTGQAESPLESYDAACMLTVVYMPLITIFLLFELLFIAFREYILILNIFNIEIYCSTYLTAKIIPKKQVSEKYFQMSIMVVKMRHFIEDYWLSGKSALFSLFHLRAMTLLLLLLLF